MTQQIQEIANTANTILVINEMVKNIEEDKLKDIQINYKEQYGNLGFRASLRLAVLQDEFEKLHKGMSNFKKQ